ncbi:MAG: CPBP family intramembrane metalloprotease [Tissierellia bacterium]|nr:CPBP family intramembrane metalloprotease [Tissierellia bacterium]
MNKNKIYIYPIIYFLLSLLGFGILYKMGIEYDDPKIHYAAIPMMLIIAGFVYKINGDKLIDLNELKPKKEYLGLNFIPFITMLLVLFTIFESFTNEVESRKVIWAFILTFLIGFSEEKMFRQFIFEEGKKFYSKRFLFLYSTIAFSLVHMANMASGLDFKSAALQSIVSLPVGLLAAFLYIETKNISALIFWHMSIDYSLFLRELGVFKTELIFSKIIDKILIIITVLLLIKKLKIYLSNRFSIFNNLTLD